MMTHDQRDAQTSPALSRWMRRTSGINRQWALRTDRPTTAEIKAGCRLYLDADTDEQLAELIAAEEARIKAVAGAV